MKKAILIIVFGLLLVGCATSDNINSTADDLKIYHADENSITMELTFWYVETMAELGAKHCAKYKKFYVDIYDEDVSNKKATMYCVSEFYSTFKGKRVISTNYDANSDFIKSISGDLTFTINDKKEQCEAIGFAPATDKFADCVLRLVELDVKSQQQKQIELAISQGNQQVANELKAQRNQQSGAYLMDLGQKLLNPTSSVSKRTTRTCTVYGAGGVKTVTCR